MLATLDGMDKQTLAVARLQQEDKNSADDRAIAERIALINRGVQYNPNEIRNVDPATLPPRQVIDDSALGEIDTIDGEMAIGISTENMTAFMTRVEPD